MNGILDVMALTSEFQSINAHITYLIMSMGFPGLSESTNILRIIFHRMRISNAKFLTKFPLVH